MEQAWGGKVARRRSSQARSPTVCPQRAWSRPREPWPCLFRQPATAVTRPPVKASLAALAADAALTETGAEATASAAIPCALTPRDRRVLRENIYKTTIDVTAAQCRRWPLLGRAARYARRPRGLPP